MVPYRRALRRFIIATPVLLSAVLIAACGGSSKPKAISLTRAANLSTSAVGFKVNETMTETIAGSTFQLNAHGTFDNKSHQGSIDASVSSGGQSYPLQIVIADGTIYERLPSQLSSQLSVHTPWISINLNELGKRVNISGLGSLLNSDSRIGDPTQYLDYLKATSSGSLKNLGQQTIKGLQTTHYSAVVDFSKLAGAVPAAQRQVAEQLTAALKRFHASYRPLGVWIDQSGLVRQVELDFTETVSGKPFSVDLTEQISAYGPQPAPAIPSASQTTDWLSLLPKSG